MRRRRWRQHSSGSDMQPPVGRTATGEHPCSSSDAYSQPQPVLSHMRSRLWGFVPQSGKRRQQTGRRSTRACRTQRKQGRTHRRGKGEGRPSVRCAVSFSTSVSVVSVAASAFSPVRKMASLMALKLNAVSSSGAVLSLPQSSGFGAR